MSVSPYTPGKIKLFGAGAPDEADISTPCVRASRDITGVSFQATSATTYGVNSGDTGDARPANHEPVKLLTLGLCMGDKVWVRLATGMATLCRVESAPEALARADVALALLAGKLELAETKRELAEQRELVATTKAERSEHPVIQAARTALTAYEAYRGPIQGEAAADLTMSMIALGVALGKKDVSRG